METIFMFSLVCDVRNILFFQKKLALAFVNDAVYGRTTHDQVKVKLTGHRICNVKSV